MREATQRAVVRFSEIVAAATRVFGRNGYRRTQVADVARELRVSPGLLYHYFESKDAMFHAALEAGLDPTHARPPERLPLPAPSREETLDMVRGCAERFAAAPEVAEALSRETVSDARAEFEALIGRFYDEAEGRRLGVDLLERSALELPEIAKLWFGEVRRAHFQNFARYLRTRMDQGHFRELPDASIAARIVIEIVVFFARHRHRDPYEKLDDERTRATVLAFVLAALVR